MKNSKRGQILIQALVLSALAVVFIAVLVNLAAHNIGAISRSLHSEQAFQIAEAGLEYYRWHLIQAPNDFTNGTGQPGPYSVDYADKDGNVIGQFVLNITSPLAGSTVVKISSTGKLNADPSASRTVEARYGKESLAKFAILANDKLTLATSTVVYGPIHSNDGIHFDGKAYNVVTSAKYDYDDPEHSGPNEYGVHTHVDEGGQGTTNQAFRPMEAPPNPVQNRPDVFVAGRLFPVPAVDYAGLTANLAQIKADAQSSGRYFANSGVFGYEIVLKTNNTFDLYTVQSLVPPPPTCNNSQGETGWGTWSVASKAFVANYPVPVNGLIFVEDHAWVSGTVNGTRATVASARFPENPSTNTSITVNSDLLYTNADGTDVVGLVAQNDISVGLMSSDILRIDAALVAKNGRIGRYYYREPSGGGNQFCGTTAVRTAITLTGIIATNKRYGFSWACGANLCSGYITRNILYDPNLLYSPPPSFPAASTELRILSWEEIRQ
jgi:hypothetical protein